MEKHLVKTLAEGEREKKEDGQKHLLKTMEHY
jgi:hypothetical protein